MIKNLQVFICLILSCSCIYGQVDTLFYKTGQIEAIGKLENNNKQGEWKWFYKNGKLMSIENYDNGEYHDGKFWKENGDSTTINDIMIQPKYPNGGITGFVKFISENLQYPPEAAKKNIQGKVIVDFNITSKGELVDFKIYKSVNESLDKEAIRVIKKSPKWIPGTLHGVNVKVAMRFPINFQL